MIMTHKNCGGWIIESKTDSPYVSEERRIVPVQKCSKCKTEILGNSQIRFFPETYVDTLQLESLRDETKE
jgi:hypothetical protein